MDTEKKYFFLRFVVERKIILIFAFALRALRYFRRCFVYTIAIMNKVESALQRTTDTKALVIGVDTLPQTAEMFKSLFPAGRALVVADLNTWRVAGKEVHRILAEAGIAQDEPRIFTDPKLYAEWTFVEELDGVLAATDAVPVAVGSGVINDLTKLCSHHNGRRYMVVGTAASMDGYTAYGASVTKDGNKQTFDCPAPLGMVLDPSISAAAPAKMSASGYADLIAKIPAGADWMLADAVGADKMDDFAFGLVQEGLKEALCDPAGVHAGNVAKVEQLAEGLLLSGFAMQATLSSRPASGAEHQFSHLWDMEHLRFNGASVSHGFKVGIGTLASTAFLEMLLDAPVEQLDVEKCVAAWKSWEETERDIRAVFDNDPEFVARGLKETRDKYVDKEGLREQLTRLKRAWPELRGRIRSQIIPFGEVHRRLELVGAPCEPEQIGISRARFRASFEKIPYMRSRYTVVDVAFRCGWMEEWLDRLFGKGGVWQVEDRGQVSIGRGVPAASGM
ncbi:glycerol-1-phosphate dehydrogenase [NAD(P)+] [Alistipes timonensis JC136]|uniref:Glycerol-1-phosphate dehydrogenase [NAD(P)+] n=2 Tax=Alistipes timonensis TaxID=1465754 RepID=A0A1H3ZUB0_9BACT|nr:glycerol-1-phosphate dehydrogenase [NAD(P)+] [Alistipes timonensis JC136]